MGRRSDFNRIENDAYFTPEAAVVRAEYYLRKHIGRRPVIEPFAGDGGLARKLSYNCDAEVVWLSDIDPRPSVDGLTIIRRADWKDGLRQKHSSKSVVVTNPPWKKDLIIDLVYDCVDLGIESTLLLSGNLLHTAYFNKLLYPHCYSICSVGRLKWIPGSQHTSKDDAAWYHFKPTLNKAYPRLFARQNEISVA